MQWWLLEKESSMSPLFMSSLGFLSCLFSPTFILCCFFTCCLRCDITAILLMVEHLMWGVCETPEALVHSSPDSTIALAAGGSDWPCQIHSSCEELLTVLIILTAPLSLLYRFVHTGNINFLHLFKKKKKKSDTDVKVWVKTLYLTRLLPASRWELSHG